MVVKAFLWESFPANKYISFSLITILDMHNKIIILIVKLKLSVLVLLLYFILKINSVLHYL